MSNLERSSPWSIEESDALYGISNWGCGYFDINSSGHLCVIPDTQNPQMQIDFLQVVAEIREQGIQLPVVIRFHDVLRTQVIQLNEAFISCMKAADYQNHYRGVFPVKVNQMREVVEEIVDAGRPYDFGLEAGSKAELLTVLAYNTNPDSLTILNGYKDEEFIELAILAHKMMRKVVIVIEKFSELNLIIRLAKQANVEPMLGIRAKMTAKGRGKWASSSGPRAKFGLTIAEMIQVAQQLKSEGLAHCLTLLHFHIGSQLPDIRSVKDAVAEAALIYAELHHMGFALQYIDVGGGLGIDYDGTNSTNDSSKNYSLQEYVADVVYGIKEVCVLENVPHPALVSESGRAISAHHSCVVTQVLGEIKPDNAQLQIPAKPDEHVLLKNMRELAEKTDAIIDVDSENSVNLHELFNDASQYKEQAQDAFTFRVLGLRELATIETLYWQVMRQLKHLYRDKAFVPEELQSLDNELSSQYLCNFSVFQSAADTWAIDQIIPVVPLSRHDETPTINVSLVDITCDSDGKIDKFAVGREISDVLPMHPLHEGEPYYLGLFLTGAYQDVMGDMHNLFGRLNEVHVFSHDDDPADFYIEEFVPGSTVENVLNVMQYNPSAMARDVKRMIDKQVAANKMKPREGVKWADFYEQCLKGYTYIKPSE